MASGKFVQRAEDNLNLNSRIIRFVGDLKVSCGHRKAVVHAVISQLSRLDSVRKNVEDRLAKAQTALAFKGIFSYIKALSKIKELKRKLSEIKVSIVCWMNSVSNHLAPRIMAFAIGSA